MYPYVVRWLPVAGSNQREAAYYLTAALFAYHPDPGGSGNLGRAFRRTLDHNEDNTAVERRFTALLTAHSDDLPFYLRQAISFLKSKEMPVDWHQLFADVSAWSHPDGYVQKQWARAFWGRAVDEDTPIKKES
jgi:CRISPR system Cascade subunit CasB